MSYGHISRFFLYFGFYFLECILLCMRTHAGRPDKETNTVHTALYWSTMVWSVFSGKVWSVLLAESQTHVSETQEIGYSIII